jgi:gliding motility-associated lipoprotein GldD
MKGNSNCKNIFQILVFLLIITCIVMFTTGCRKAYTPKPRSYFRIEFPKKEYVLYKSECNFSFEVPVYAKVVPYQGSNAEPCWMNITFPEYKGTIYITYKKIHNDIDRYAEDIRTLAYKHIIKADDIIEQPVSFPDRDIHGMIYNIKGNTASSLNFFITDSTDNFLSGSLYFNVIPNKDSLAPVIRFFSDDIEHLINTFRWK